MQKQFITFNGQEYLTDKLRVQAGSCPLIEVKAGELALDFRERVKVDGANSNDPIAVYQYEGSYFVLLGIEKVEGLLSADPEKTVFKARLITKHVLKKTVDIDISAQLINQGVQDISEAPRRFGDRGGDRTPFRGRDRDYAPRDRRW